MFSFGPVFASLESALADRLASADLSFEDMTTGPALTLQPIHVVVSLAVLTDCFLSAGCRADL
jgi:hypothetical protein